MIKAIVFDLWNTLIPATVDFGRLTELAKKDHASLPEFIERYELATQLKQYKSFEELKGDFFNAFSEEPNVLLQEEINEIYTNRFDKINFFPDVREFLKKLRSDGFKLGLLSNTESLKSKELENKLSLPTYFDKIVYSFEIKTIKPDPVAFNTILNKLKVKPNEAIMVGDSLRSDITGSKNVGMHNCLINRNGKVIDYASIKPEFEIKSLFELPKVVGVLNGRK